MTTTVRDYVTSTYFCDETSPNINDWKYMYQTVQVFGHQYINIIKEMII